MELFLPSGMKYLLGGSEIGISGMNVTLRSIDSGAVLDGQLMSRILSITEGSLNLVHVHLRRGANVSHGAALAANWSTVSLSSCSIEDCHSATDASADAQGGAMYLYSSKATLLYTVVALNTVTAAGAAALGGFAFLSSGSASSIMAVSCAVANCTALVTSLAGHDARGGAFAIAEGSHLILVATTVSTCRAESLRNYALGEAALTLQIPAFFLPPPHPSFQAEPSG